MKKVLVGALFLLLTALPLIIQVNALKPGIDFGGTHYNLNLIGKKNSWSGGGSYDNPDRHTMFVPEDTEGWTFTVGTQTFDGIKISMTQGTEFAVLDGSAFPDGQCSFQLGPGKYRVYVVARAKPGFSTDITGWVYYYYSAEFFYSLGTVTVTKNKWQDATDLFYVSPTESTGSLVPVYENTWVFDWLNALTAAGAQDAAYFWQYDNGGNKLVQVRFYPIS